MANPDHPSPPSSSPLSSVSDGEVPIAEVASAKLLRAGIIIAICGCLLGLILLPLLAPGQSLRYVGLVAILIVALGAEALFRAGRIRHAYIALVWGIWAAIIASSAINGGVRSPVVTAIPVTILLGGLLLGYRTALALTAATVAVLVFFGLTADTGLLPSAARAHPFWRATVLLISVAFALAIVRYVLTNQAANYAALHDLNRNLAEQLALAQLREAQLVERTHEYTTLLDAQSQAGIGLFTVRDDRITFANQAFCELIGYTQEELLAFESSELIAHPDERAQIRANYLRRRQGESFESRYEVSMLTKTGERRVCEVTATRVTDHPSADVLAIVVDNEHQARAEAELTKSKEMFRKAFTSSPLAITISRLEDGLYLDVNPGWEKIFGWSRDELIGVTAVQVGIWPSLEARQAWVGRLRQQGHVSDMETTLLNKQRDTLIATLSATVIDVGGEPCVLVFIQDITQWRQAQASLRLSEERFSNVFRTSPVPASIARIADGHFIEINDAFVEQFGRSREDTLGRTSLETGQWGSRVERMEWISRLKAAGTLRDFETVMYRADGTARAVSISAALGDFGGEQCIIAYIYDITDKRAAEEAILTINAELEKRVAARTTELSETNRELEAFAYSISHDLRAPLRGIDGFSRLLESDYGRQLDDTGREYLDRIRRAAQRMGTLINDLLELSRVSRQAMKQQPVNLSAIANEVIRTLVETDPTRKVSIHITPDCLAQGDPPLLQSVMENLLGNAWKYSRKNPDARIEFGTLALHRAPDAAADASNASETRVDAGDDVASGQTAFFVRDNGAGFDMAYATWLFTPFQRLHGIDEFEGSGIGLASAARIIGRHGGRIWAEAAPDKGACFYFTLPPLPAEIKN